VLVLEGELDMSNAAKLDEALHACTDDLPVIVDLSALTFVDSTSLHVLLKNKRVGRPCAIVRAPGSNVGRIIDIVDADKTIPVYGDVAEAIGRLAS
jgi:anti-sigma B factor antagonist